MVDAVIGGRSSMYVLYCAHQITPSTGSWPRHSLSIPVFSVPVCDKAIQIAPPMADAARLNAFVPERVLNDGTALRPAL
jgi:hypothetical protein